MRLLRYVATFVIGIVIGILAAIAGASFCTNLWPSLNAPAAAPSVADFSGNYLPMPGTARLLKDRYPGVQTSLDFNGDGTCVFTSLPTGRQSSDNATVTEHGTWSIKKIYRKVQVEVLDQAGNPIDGFDLKGQKPPYVINTWNDRYQCSMEFCPDPAHSPATRDYKTLSTTDNVITCIIIFTVLILPFLLPSGSGARAFGYPFALTLAWGGWRMGYFDGVTSNDIPGGGYIVVAGFNALLARGLFAVHVIRSRGRQQKSSQSAPPIS
jgi:hypothetical protein